MTTATPAPTAVLHADADAFFVGVERRHDPSLRGRPVAVADGVVCCASYEARGHGVRGGMSSREATRRCPALVLVPPSGDRYDRASRDLFALFASVSASVEPASMEEAFLVPPAGTSPVAVARELRRRAQAELDLPVSVGVAGSRLWAKVASRRAKPGGVVHLGDGEVGRLREELPLADAWSIGPRTVERLAEVGLTTLGHVAEVDPTSLRDLVGTRMARRLRAIVTGTDAEPLRPGPRSYRTTSAQRTTAGIDGDRVGDHVDDLADRVARRARADERVGDTLTLDVVARDHRARSAVRLLAPTHDPARLVAAARDLARDADVRALRRVVLVRLTLGGLAPRARQTQLALPIDDPAA